MHENAEYFLVLTRGLRSTLNLSLGLSANNLDPINGKIIKERVDAIKKGIITLSNSHESNNFALYTQTWSLMFAIRFSNAPKWASLPLDKKESLKEFCSMVSVANMCHTPIDYSKLIISIIKHISPKVDKYGEIYQLLVYLIIYGLLTNNTSIVGSAAITIMETLE